MRSGTHILKGQSVKHGLWPSSGGTTKGCLVEPCCLLWGGEVCLFAADVENMADQHGSLKAKKKHCIFYFQLITHQ